MPNFATELKAEISRLARKELRPEVDALRKAMAGQRAEIASLKRRLAAAERTISALSKSRPPAAAREAAPADEEGRHRFTAGGLASNRKRLGLSAADFGLLVGTTGQSVYAWESGKSVPRAKYLAAIAALRGMGKKVVAERLAALSRG
jgi:DNA-binding transcriptional regulator YiaG